MKCFESFLFLTSSQRAFARKGKALFKHTTRCTCHAKSPKRCKLKEFLVNTLPVLLEEVSLAAHARTWFQHDGAPVHFSHLERQQLTATFGDRWMGHLGPILWPARSPDFNPLDFVLWGYLKTLVYATPADHVNDLLPRIVDGCNTIHTTPGLLEWVREPMLRLASFVYKKEASVRIPFVTQKLPRVIVCFCFVSYYLFV